MDVTIERPARTRTSALAPEDFEDIAPCESVGWGDDGALVVRFAGDLTPAQELAVKIRCITSDADEEAILTSAAQAYQRNQDFLALDVRTTAQNLAQVESLTRQVNALLRYVARL